MELVMWIETLRNVLLFLQSENDSYIKSHINMECQQTPIFYRILTPVR